MLRQNARQAVSAAAFAQSSVSSERSQWRTTSHTSTTRNVSAAANVQRSARRRSFPCYDKIYINIIKTVCLGLKSRFDNDTVIRLRQKPGNSAEALYEILWRDAVNRPVWPDRIVYKNCILYQFDFISVP